MSQSDKASQQADAFDYVIVGGGTAGLTLASRLYTRFSSIFSRSTSTSKPGPTPSILVIEAGGNPSQANAHPDYENVRNYTTMNQLRASSVTSWAMPCDNGTGLENRITDAAAGKGLGGSSLINAGMWMRGPKTDWDFWAREVNDESWTYDNMIRFFRLSENVVSLEDSKNETSHDSQHSQDGYVKVRPTSATDKCFPLRDSVLNMWKEVGVNYIPDMNSGYQNGACECIDIWDKGGARQIPGDFLDLDGVEVWTNIQVAKVTISDEPHALIATGVVLTDGRTITARREVILSAGAYHSPKLLQLSGIGDKTLLDTHDIDVKHHNPAVGANLADHLIVTLTWQLHRPEEGLAFGSPKCTEEFWLEGLPQDIVQYEHIPTSKDGDLATVLSSSDHTDTDRDYVLRPDASHIQNWLVYLPLPAVLTGTDVPVNGSFISTFTCLVSPTSRGHVKIASTDPTSPPSIDKNFQSTPGDQYMLTHGLRRISDVILNTKIGQSFIDKEVPPPGFPPITPDTTDAEIQDRIARFAWSISHPMGTCGMGKVVDSKCRVIGIRGLRVVDASVIPVPIAATIQAVVYALAERAAEFIIGGD